MTSATINERNKEKITGLSAWVWGKLFDLGESEFTGSLRLEFNFHKGDISKKVKCGIIETLTYPNK